MPPRLLLTVILAFTLAGCAQPTQPAAPTAPPTRQPEPTPTPEPFPDTPPPAPAATTVPESIPNLPDAAAYQWNPVVSGLAHPIDIRNAGDARLFIVEQRGRIRILKDGQLLLTPLIDIVGRVGSNGSEQGLLGLAFHPKFSENGYFFVNYTDKNGNTHISRFTASGDTADPSSEKELITVTQPFANHNGGSLAFGPDGYLYIGLGDGGSGGDPYDNAQSLETWLGKILRIDVNVTEVQYGVPADNPFENIQLREIWAYGLRNPWRFSFDSLTGDFYIADVGQNEIEELNFVAAGEPGGINFGWNDFEGMQVFEGGNAQNVRMPVTQYSHADGCAITGGYVYRGQALPAWNGVYLYGDYCSGLIWGMIHHFSTDGKEETFNSTLLFNSGLTISTFGVDQAGEIYLADYNNGTVYRLEKAK